MSTWAHSVNADALHEAWTDQTRRLGFDPQYIVADSLNRATPRGIDNDTRQTMIEQTIDAKSEKQSLIEWADRRISAFGIDRGLGAEPSRGEQSAYSPSFDGLDRNQPARAQPVRHIEVESMEIDL